VNAVDILYFFFIYLHFAQTFKMLKFDAKDKSDYRYMFFLYKQP